MAPDAGCSPRQCECDDPRARRAVELNGFADEDCADVFSWIANVVRVRRVADTLHSHSVSSEKETGLSPAAPFALLFRAVPGFEAHIASYRAGWGTDEPGLCNEYGELATYVRDLVTAGDTQALPALFAVVEKLLMEGTDYVQTAAATGFLEGLQNMSTEEVARAWVPLLGSASQAYCRAWDEFTGVRTPWL
jgi:hypothetical protein